MPVRVTNVDINGTLYDTPEVEITLRGNLDSNEMTNIHEVMKVGNMFKVNELFSVKDFPCNSRVCLCGKEVKGKAPESKKETKLIFGGSYTDKSGKPVYITKVLYSGPATIVFWNDGTKTSSKCDARDTYSAETGLVLAVLKKVMGGDFVAKTIADWNMPEVYDEKEAKRGIAVTLKDVRAKHRVAEEEAKLAKLRKTAKDGANSEPKKLFKVETDGSPVEPIDNSNVAIKRAERRKPPIKIPTRNLVSSKTM